jgi:hypothetical protein
MAGVSDPTQYEADSWTVAEIEIFDVGEEFPRISAEELPESVSGVKYTLSLSGLETSAIGLEEALDTYLGGTNG